MSLASPTPENPLSGLLLPRTAPGAPGAVGSGLNRPRPNRQAHLQYQQTQIETASPTRLIVLLYDGAIRFCSFALEAMQARQLEVQNTNLIKAQRILAELMGSLNRDVGGEVADNLFRLYTHMLEQLVQANLTDDKVLVENVMKMLRELRETWVEVDLLTTQAIGGAEGAAPRTVGTLGEQSG